MFLKFKRFLFCHRPNNQPVSDKSDLAEAMHVHSFQSRDIRGDLEGRKLLVMGAHTAEMQQKNYCFRVYLYPPAVFGLYSFSRRGMLSISCPTPENSLVFVPKDQRGKTTTGRQETLHPAWTGHH